MAEDIISTVPWHCGNTDGCEQGWHLANYWVYDDGDHDPCENADVPTYEEEQQAWRDYYQHVARTGLDPIGQFRLPCLGKVKRIWQARLRTWIGISLRGPRVCGVRRRGRGRWLSLTESPPEVVQYLEVEGDAIPQFKGNTEEAFAAVAAANVLRVRRRGLELLIWFEVEEPRKEWNQQRTKAWLRAKAREALRSRN
jgi:hypothetical protein